MTRHNSTVSSALTYEDLRKQARILENDINVKLVAFSKLAAGLKTPSASNTSSVLKYKDKHNSASEDSVPLLANASTDEDAFDSMSLEIEQQLQKLGSIGEQIQEQPVSGAAMLHTLRRHRDIFTDLSRDYVKTSRERQTRRDREELLGGNNNLSSARDGINNRSNSTYLKENIHLNNSDRLVSDQIAIAMEAKEHLTGQRRTLKGIQTRFNDMNNRFPMINSLLQRINVRKRRDSIILGLVVSVCTLLLLLYAFL